MDIPSLLDLQRWMQSRIRPDAAHVATAREVALNPQRGTPGLERLSVYAGGYLARVQDALAEGYAAVHHVLGASAFAALAGRYAVRQPSHDYNLSLLGRHLSAFLADDPLTTSLPFLPDLARLEWAVCEAFHAVERPPLDASRLTAWTPEAWERARVVFQPSVHLVSSAWPILDLWQARAQPRERIIVDLINRPQQVLIRRRALTVLCERLTPDAARLLERLLDGGPLGSVCAALAREGVQPHDLTAWWARWAGEGLIVQVHHDTLPPTSSVHR